MCGHGWCRDGKGVEARGLKCWRSAVGGRKNVDVNFACDA